MVLVKIPNPFPSEVKLSLYWMVGLSFTLQQTPRADIDEVPSEVTSPPPVTKGVFAGVIATLTSEVVTTGTSLGASLVQLQIQTKNDVSIRQKEAILENLFILVNQRFQKTN